MSNENDKLAHFFHWPSFGDYQVNLIQNIALPISSRGRLYYDKRWVNDSFLNEIGNINEGKRLDGILWALGCEQEEEGEKYRTIFKFACPIRKVLIVDINEKNDFLYISFISQKYASSFEKYNEGKLKSFLNITFDEQGIPFPGSEKGYVHVGPNISVDSTNELNLSSLHEVLKDIPCSKAFKEAITIGSYPLIKIEPIENSNLNENGFFELLKDKTYKIPFFFLQDYALRGRSIYINGYKYLGKQNEGILTIEEAKKSTDKVNIEVKYDNSDFIIPIDVDIKIPFLKKKFVPFFILLILSFIAFSAFLFFYCGSSIEIKSALGFALLVVCIEKIYEAFTK